MSGWPHEPPDPARQARNDEAAPQRIDWSADPDDGDLTHASAWPAAPDGPPPPVPPPPSRPQKSRGTAWIAAGVAALLVAAAAVGAIWILRPSDSAVAASGAVRDIREEPERAWTYAAAERRQLDWVTPSPTVVPLGDNQFGALLAHNAEHLYEQSGSTWYVGYDEHYETGYLAGVDYSDALERYNQNWRTNPYPAIEDYWTLDGNYYSDSHLPERVGWTHGFWDGSEGRALGASRAERPADPPVPARVVALNRQSGEETWSIDLADLGLVPGQGSVGLYGGLPTAHLALELRADSRDDAEPTVLYFLDAATGEVAAQRELASEEWVATRSTDAVGHLITVRDDTVYAWDPERLDSGSAWSTPLDAEIYSTSHGSSSFWATTEDGAVHLDVRTGEEPGWFDGPDPDFSYYFVGDYIARVESASFGYYVDMLDQEGQVLWSADTERFMHYTAASGSALFFGELNSAGEVTDVMRIDPRTGEELWESSYRRPVGWVSGLVGGQVVFSIGGGAIDVVDLETGDRTFRLREDSARQVVLGGTVIYAIEEGRLRAWDAGEGTELWSLRLRNDRVLTVGSDLLTFNTDRRELSWLN